jgi:hypothetical protein
MSLLMFDWSITSRCLSHVDIHCYIYASDIVWLFIEFYVEIENEDEDMVSYNLHVVFIFILQYIELYCITWK